MAKLSPLYLALLAAQLLAEQLGQTREIVQHLGTPPRHLEKQARPVTTQLAQAKQTVHFLAEQLAHDAREQEGVHRVTTQLAQATAAAQVLTKHFAQSQARLGQLAEQLDHTQATIQQLTTQLEYDLARSAGGVFLEEPLDS